MSPQLAGICLDLGIAIASLAARGLCEHEEASHLALAETADNGREHQLTPPAAAAWRAMKEAAARDGIEIHIVSAYRSIARQIEIIRSKLDAGMGIEAILEVNAAPGFSEHHTGRAVDIATPGSPALATAFDSTPAFVWLMAHAGEFGFTLSYPAGNSQGYQYEPWHWCFQTPPTQI